MSGYQLIGLEIAQVIQYSNQGEANQTSSWTAVNILLMRTLWLRTGSLRVVLGEKLGKPGNTWKGEIAHEMALLYSVVVKSISTTNLNDFKVCYFRRDSAWRMEDWREVE